MKRNSDKILVNNERSCDIRTINSQYFSVGHGIEP